MTVTTTPSLTVSEARSAKAYEESVDGSGLADCFDSLDVRHIRWHEGEFGTKQTRHMLQQHASMLNSWYLALDTLLGDMLTCTTEYSRYSPAAQEYVTQAAARYHEVRQAFEYANTAWSLGLLTHTGGVDYPPPTKNVNFPMQCLSSE